MNYYKKYFKYKEKYNKLKKQIAGANIKDIMNDKELLYKMYLIFKDGCPGFKKQLETDVKNLKNLYSQLNKTTQTQKVIIEFVKPNPKNRNSDFNIIFSEHSLSDFINNITYELDNPLRGGVSVGSNCWWTGIINKIIKKLMSYIDCDKIKLEELGRDGFKKVYSINNESKDILTNVLSKMKCRENEEECEKNISEINLSNKVISLINKSSSSNTYKTGINFFKENQIQQDIHPNVIDLEGYCSSQKNSIPQYYKIEERFHSDYINELFSEKEDRASSKYGYSKIGCACHSKCEKQNCILSRCFPSKCSVNPETCYNKEKAICIPEY